MSRTTIELDLNQLVETLPRVGPSVAVRLKRLGIRTIRDLLTHWPRTWRDMSVVTPIRSLKFDEFAVVRGTIHDVRLERWAGQRLVRVIARLQDDAGDELPVLWFNQGYLTRLLKEGSTYLLAGTLKWDRFRRQRYLANPTRETGLGIVPIYPETEGLTSRFFSTLINPLLPELSLPDPLKKSDQLSLTAAVRAMHRPTTLEETNQAQSRLVFDEHLMLQLQLAKDRQRRVRQTAPSIPPSVTALKQLVNSLPFQLTTGQRQAAWQLIQRLKRQHPTNQLLQGDVGTGKTVVALLVALSVLEAGYDVTWLVPTQVLARQMYARLSGLLNIANHSVVLVMQGERPPALPTQALFVGTHALLTDRPSSFPLGLVIVDEQQRFGVVQRQQAMSATNGLFPHVLTMTATPIPRSLALAILGQESLVTLTDRPIHQQPITTRLIDDRSLAVPILQGALTERQQAFVIVPRIANTTDQLFRDSIDQVAAGYRDLLPTATVAIIHGQQAAELQEATLHQFETGVIDVLVATTVVEVGVDVPNATVIVIEQPQHFGLAQLHQLRGRIGRGLKPGTCLVIQTLGDEVVDERLSVFASTTDGFVLATKDLELRGPGEVLGTLQSGLPPFKLARLDDTLLVDRAKVIVEQWLINAPGVLEAWQQFWAP